MEPQPTPPAPTTKPWHPWAALAFTVALIGGGVTALHFWLQPSPQVRTLIYVPAPSAQILPAREAAPDVASHQRNQVAMARSRLVLGSALKDPKVANLPAISNMVDPVEWLEREVTVDFTVAPDIMKIAMRGRNVEELVVLVNAVREAYVREIVETQQQVRAQRQTVLEELVRKYENQLRGAREAQQEDARVVGGAGADFRSRLHAHLTAQLSQEDRDWLSAKSQLAKSRLKLEGLQDQEKNLDKKVVTEHEITEVLAEDKAFARNRPEIEILESKIAETAKHAGKGEKDPVVVRYRDLVKKLQAENDDLRKRKMPEIVKEIKKQRYLQVQQDRLALEGRINDLKRAAEHHEKEFKRLTDQIAKYEKGGAKLDLFQSEITHLEGTLTRLKYELEAIKIEREAPSRVRLIEPASVQRRPG